MISVQQIADLEARVLRAVDLIERLRGENRTLSAALDSSEKRARELEGTLEELRGGQQEVEQIIVRTLQKLDGLENAWAELEDGDQADGAAETETASTEAPPVVPAPPPSAVPPPVPPGSEPAGPGPASPASGAS